VKTRCPECQTTFWVTPEQLKARAGMVRCGQCQKVFNAIDQLQEEAAVTATASPSGPPPPDEIAPPPPTAEVPVTPESVDAEAPAEPLSEAAAQELGKAVGLILPRETAEIPGYSRWAEGVMSSSPLSEPAGRSANRPFVLVALLLLLTLAGQIVFHARSEIAVAAPSLRPLLDAFSGMLGTDIPLPRHADLVSIETSDLQADPTRGKLLVLQATLRNRASYAQDYPLLELALTDTQDGAIARRVFRPDEYLSPQTPSRQAFPANSDLAVRLWIEAKGISAAGYRLYVFYP